MSPDLLRGALEDAGLADVAKRPASSLSGGEQRRLELARARLGDPSLLLLDEPFSGVDPDSVQDLQARIRDLARRGIGVLYSDHNIAAARDFCDRAYLLNEGRLLDAGPPSDLLSRR